MTAPPPYTDAVEVEIDTEYYYRIAACSTTHISSCSEQSPAAGTVVSLASNPTSIHLSTEALINLRISWAAVPGGDVFYRLFYAADGGSEEELYAGTDTSFFHPGRDLDVNNAYRVVACLDDTPESCLDGGRRAQRTLTINPPSELTGRTTTSLTSVHIRWNHVHPLYGYQLYRLTAGDYLLIAEEGFDIRRRGSVGSGLFWVNYTDTGLTSGTTYSYKVRSCVTLEGDTHCSALSTLTAQIAPLILQPPSIAPSVTAIRNALGPHIVTWGEAARFPHLPAYYEVARSTQADGSDRLPRTGGDGQPPHILVSAVRRLEFTDWEIGGSDYYYWVRACNAAGCGAYGRSAVVEPPATNSIRLNDTGVTFGGYTTSITLLGVTTTTHTGSCSGSPTSPQDCNQGRDPQAVAGTLRKYGSGPAGFDLTWLAENGTFYDGRDNNYSNVSSQRGQRWYCVLDNHTGLLWEVPTLYGRFLYTGTPPPLQFQFQIPPDNAIASMNLNELISSRNSRATCGRRDWRLPTLHEMATITNQGGGDNIGIREYFPTYVAGRYWTSTPDSRDSTKHWFIDLSTGLNGTAARTNSYNVRLVSDRGMPEVAALRASGNNPRYTRETIMGGEVVTDRLTGLMWTRCALPASNCSILAPATWLDALTNAAGSNHAGFTNWRLPNLEELRSIVDYSRVTSVVNNSIFQGLSTDLTYWTSTPVNNETNARAYAIHFGLGTVIEAPRTDSHTLLLVRDP